MKKLVCKLFQNIYFLAGIMALFSLTPANAQVACSPSNLTLNFGAINIFSSTTIWNSGNFTISCTNTAPVAISAYACLSVGTGTGGISATNRNLASGANRIPVQISATAGGAQIGNGSSYPMEGPLLVNLPANSSTNVNFPISVGILPGSLAPVGTYTSNFTGADFTVFGNTSAFPPSSCASLTGGLQINGTLSVTATVANQCNVSSTNMNFGIASILNNPITTSATVTVTCNSPTIPVTVALDNGSYGTGPIARKMASGANRVTYGIYQNSTYTNAWGSTSGSDTQNITGSGNLTAYGRIPAQLSPAPGSYSDVVTVTITY